MAYIPRMRFPLYAILWLVAVGCRGAAPAPAPVSVAPPPAPEQAQDPEGRAAVEAVREWLAHPAELGKPPRTASLVWRDTREWPFHDGRQPVYLVAYESDEGVRGIAVTGPITWSFFEIDFAAFSHEELARLYAGWFINFALINTPDAAATQARAKPVDEIVAALAHDGFTNVAVLDRLQIGDDTYFAARATQGSSPVIVAGSVGSITVLDPASHLMTLPPLYWYLGETFYGD